jgi:hypothetical protein
VLLPRCDRISIAFFIHHLSPHAWDKDNFRYRQSKVSSSANIQQEGDYIGLDSGQEILHGSVQEHPQVGPISKASLQLWRSLGVAAVRVTILSRIGNLVYCTIKLSMPSFLEAKTTKRGNLVEAQAGQRLE